jgi:hypothetical protein
MSSFLFLLFTDDEKSTLKKSVDILSNTRKSTFKMPNCEFHPYTAASTADDDEKMFSVRE